MGKLHVFKFCGDDGVPFNSSVDNPFRYQLVVGGTVRHDGPVVMCESGLHFSRTEDRAAQYASFDPALGLWCLVVEIDDADIHAEDADDKFVLKAGAVATVVAVENRHLTGKDGEPTDISSGVWIMSGGTIERVSGGTIDRVLAGTIDRVYGGTIGIVHGGTIENVHGGTIGIVHGGTIENVHGGTIGSVHGGTIGIVNGGTIEDVWGGTIEDVWGGTIESVHGGTIGIVNGGTIEDVWGGTIEDVWGGTIENAGGCATIVFHNGKIEHIIEDSEAFVVDRSGTHVAGYDAKTWNARAKS